MRSTLKVGAHFSTSPTTHNRANTTPMSADVVTRRNPTGLAATGAGGLMVRNATRHGSRERTHVEYSTRAGKRPVYRKSTQAAKAPPRDRTTAASTRLRPRSSAQAAIHAKETVSRGDLTKWRPSARKAVGKLRSPPALEQYRTPP